jgi:hypothetical protein
MVNRENKLEQVITKLEEILHKEYNNTLTKSKISLTTEHRRLIEKKSIKLIKKYIKLISDKLKKIWNPENSDIPYHEIITLFNKNIELIITKISKGNYSPNSPILSKAEMSASLNNVYNSLNKANAHIKKLTRTRPPPSVPKKGSLKKQSRLNN